ncbi:hypothetical protein IC582_022489 [Cucumis melo]
MNQFVDRSNLFEIKTKDGINFREKSDLEPDNIPLKQNCFLFFICSSCSCCCSSQDTKKYREKEKEKKKGEIKGSLRNACSRR